MSHRPTPSMNHGPTCRRGRLAGDRPVTSQRIGRPLAGILIAAAALVAIAGPSIGQTTPPGPMGGAVSAMEDRLAAATAELNATRERISAERLPLVERMTELEAQVRDAQAAYDARTAQRDRAVSESNRIKRTVDQTEQNVTYILNTLQEYQRNFKSRLHIAEAKRYGPAIDTATSAVDDTSISRAQKAAALLDLVELSLGRLDATPGGDRFDGLAKTDDDVMRAGTFVVFGPSAVFRSADGDHVGSIAQGAMSLEPGLVAFDPVLDAVQADAVTQLVTSGGAFVPIDPTLGNAVRVAATEETLLEHVKKGGPVMWPIFIMAGLALLVGLYKFARFLFVRGSSSRGIRRLLEVVVADDRTGAASEVKRIKGPTGRMLAHGVRHLDEPRELVEEIMYEEVLSTRLKLQSMLPFIAICAAAAPLLGLLGTVTGIINTFKLITVFGTGDPQVLSGGISEALITTKFGLVVAIPALLLHALLSRWARGIVDRMEKTAVSFANAVGRRDHRAELARGAADASMGASIRPPAPAGTDPRDEPAIPTVETTGHVSADVLVGGVPERLTSTEPPSNETEAEVRRILADMLAPAVTAGVAAGATAAARGDGENHEARGDA